MILFFRRNKQYALMHITLGGGVVAEQNRVCGSKAKAGATEDPTFQNCKCVKKNCENLEQFLSICNFERERP